MTEPVIEDAVVEQAALTPAGTAANAVLGDERGFSPGGSAVGLTPARAAEAIAQRGGRVSSAQALALQRTLGNRAAARVLGRRPEPGSAGSQRAGAAASAPRQLLRTPTETKLDAAGDYVLVQDAAERKTVISFRGSPWVTMNWRRGEPSRVYLEQGRIATESFWGSQVSLRVISDGWATINISRATEDLVIASIPSTNAALAYDFRLDGELTGVNDALGQPFKAPVWRRVEERRPGLVIRNPEAERKPEVTERNEITKSYDLPDTFQSFADEKALSNYLKSQPQLKAAIIQMPDGHFVVRELNEAELRQLAAAARESKYRPESLQYVGRYRSKLASGSFQSLWLDGANYTLGDLADRYFTDDYIAAVAPGTYRECEVFEMGRSSYGRRPLTHAQAVARLEQFDKLSRDDVLKLESEPGHQFHALWVAGVSGELHEIDAGYLQGREDFRAKLASLKAAADDAARDQILTRATKVEYDYLMVEVDREHESAEVASALAGQTAYARSLQLYLWTQVSDWAQRQAHEILVKSVGQVRAIVDDDSKLRAFIAGFPRLSREAQSEALMFIGVPQGSVSAWMEVLNKPQQATEVAMGNPISYDAWTVSIANLRAFAKKNMDAVESFAEDLLVGKVEAIKVAGPFGDNIRTLAYRHFGFKTLKPDGFPHRDRVPESWPGPLGGKRSDFSSLAEQLFASHARTIGSLETLEKYLTAAAIIIPVVAAMIALNVLGLIIAEAVFGLAEGTLAWFVVGGGIGGALGGGAQVAVQALVGQDVTAGGAALTVLEGAGMGLFFGGFGRLLKGVGAGWRIAGMGATFLAASATAESIKRGKPLWKWTTDEQAFWFYQNAVTFALLEAGSVAARPLTERAGIWSRMQRLGVLPEERAAFMADAVRLNRDLAAFAVRPQRADSEAAALEQRYTDLLARQRKLVQDATSVIRGQERSAALDQELKAELDVIDAQLRSMKAVRFLADLKVKPVGETQTAFEYTPAPNAKARFEQFYSGSEVAEEPGGIITVKLAGSKDLLVFIPAGSAAPPPIPSPGAPTASGKVDVNSATAKELVDKVPGIGKKLAEKIVAERESRGGFKSVDELQSIIGAAAFAKAAPTLTAAPATPPPTLQARLLALDARRTAILERSERTGITDPTIDRLRKMNIGNRRTEKALTEADQLLTAAEKTGGSKIDKAAQAATKARTSTVGKEGMQAAKADVLAGMTDVEVGEALLPFKGARDLTPAAIRGALHARRAGVDLRGFAETAKGASVAERNFALESYGRMKDARVAGADTVITDMGGSHGKWVGGTFALEYIRFDVGIENVAQLEMRIEVDGVVREIDVVLKDGTKVELKNWGEWDRFKSGLISTEPGKKEGEFLRDCRQAGYDPAMFKHLRYVFREPAPAPLTQIRSDMRASLETVLEARIKANAMTRDQSRDVLAAFDAETDLIKTSPARASGAPATPPPTAPPTGPPPATQRDDDKTKVPPGALLPTGPGVQ